MKQYRLRTVTAGEYTEAALFCSENGIPFSTQHPLTEEQAVLLRLRFKGARIQDWDWTPDIYLHHRGMTKPAIGLNETI